MNLNLWNLVVLLIVVQHIEDDSLLY